MWHLASVKLPVLLRDWLRRLELVSGAFWFQNLLLEDLLEPDALPLHHCN